MGGKLLFTCITVQLWWYCSKQVYFARWQLAVLSPHGSACKLGCSQLVCQEPFSAVTRWSLVGPSHLWPTETAWQGRDTGMTGPWLAGCRRCGLHVLCSALCPGEAEVSAERRDSDLFKDVRYAEAVSINQLLVPSKLVLADTGTNCRARTCTHKSKQGDFLLLPAASDLKRSRKWVKPTGA